MAIRLEDGLRALGESTELAKSIRIDLDAEYLHAIEFMEGLPQNQTGADKTWIAQAIEEFNRHYANARRK